MAVRGACAAEYRRCIPRPTTYRAQTCVCSRTWWSRMHYTTHTITYSWVASEDTHLPRNCAISRSKHVSPPSRQQPQTGSTSCLLSFRGGALPSHRGRNSSVRRVFYWKSCISLTPVMRNARTGTNGLPGISAAQPRPASKRTGANE